jgi:hypothetical protein
MVKSLLDAMRRNPVGDWRIEDVERLCRQHGLTFRAPSGGGSHYKVSHPASPTILAVPRARPIKAVYIRQLVALVSKYGDPK